MEIRGDQSGHPLLTNQKMKRLTLTTIATLLLTLFAGGVQAVERQRLNFNGDWRLCIGDVPEASKPEFDDSQWQRVTLPYAFNGDEAFRKDIVDLTDTIVGTGKPSRPPSYPPDWGEAPMHSNTSPSRGRLGGGLRYLSSSRASARGLTSI